MMGMCAVHEKRKIFDLYSLELIIFYLWKVSFFSPSFSFTLDPHLEMYVYCCCWRCFIFLFFVLLISILYDTIFMHLKTVLMLLSLLLVYFWFIVQCSHQKFNGFFFSISYFCFFFFFFLKSVSDQAKEAYMKAKDVRRKKKTVIKEIDSWEW